MLLDGLVTKLRGCEDTHGLQRQIAEVGLPVGQELAQLVAGPHQQVGLAVVVDDEADGLKENSILCVGMLDLLRLWWFLSLVEDGLETLVQSRSDSRILGRGIVLEEPQELDRELGGRHEVVGVVLKVCIGRGHDPRQPGHG